MRRRIEALEGKSQRAHAATACPLCESGTLKVKKVSPHPHFGEMGLQIREMRCNNPDCGHTEEREFDPSRR